MSDRTNRTTWIDDQDRTWRIELIGPRWSLSLYRPSTDTWDRIGSYPTRDGAWTAAYEHHEEGTF
jgi:hypothetical protein